MMNWIRRLIIAGTLTTRGKRILIRMVWVIYAIVTMIMIGMIVMTATEMIAMIMIVASTLAPLSCVTIRLITTAMDILIIRIRMIASRIENEDRWGKGVMKRAD
jgi:hypothetical protein